MKPLRIYLTYLNRLYNTKTMKKFGLFVGYFIGAMGTIISVLLSGVALFTGYLAYALFLLVITLVVFVPMAAYFLEKA